MAQMLDFSREIAIIQERDGDSCGRDKNQRHQRRKPG